MLSLLLILLVGRWAWATLLVVGGAILTTSSTGFGPWSPMSVTLIGLAGVCAGVVVFEIMVADRLFPKSHRGLAYSVEITSCALIALFTVSAIITVATGR